MPKTLSFTLTQIALACTLLAAATPASAALIYVSDTAGDFLQYNTLTGASTALGHNGVLLYGMAYATSGTLYANDQGSNPNNGFYSVNTTNGALTSIADVSGYSGAATDGAVASNGGGTMYFVANGTDALYTIDPTTAVLTEIGPMGVSISGGWDFNYGPDGNLYLSSGGNLYDVNATTGSASKIGSFGVGNMQSIAAADGALYGFGGSAMYSIDLADGAATFIRNTPGTFESEATVFGSFQSTPEPSTLLLGLGTLLGFGTLRYRKSRQ